jgi:hypothetical protein
MTIDHDESEYGIYRSISLSYFYIHFSFLLFLVFHINHEHVVISF